MEGMGGALFVQQQQRGQCCKRPFCAAVFGFSLHVVVGVFSVCGECVCSRRGVVCLPVPHSPLGHTSCCLTHLLLLAREGRCVGGAAASLLWGFVWLCWVCVVTDNFCEAHSAGGQQHGATECYRVGLGATAAAVLQQAFDDVWPDARRGAQCRVCLQRAWFAAWRGSTMRVGSASQITCLTRTLVSLSAASHDMMIDV